MVLLVHQQFDRSGVRLRSMPAQGQAIEVAGMDHALAVSWVVSASRTACARFRTDSGRAHTDGRYRAAPAACLPR